MNLLGGTLLFEFPDETYLAESRVLQLPGSEDFVYPSSSRLSLTTRDRRTHKLTTVVTSLAQLAMLTDSR